MATAKRSHLDIPLAEAQRSYEDQLSGLDSIKTTIRAVFSSASLIVSLGAALQLLTVTVAPEWFGVYRTLLTVIAILYAALIVLCISGMWPVYTHYPIPLDWDQATSLFKEMTDLEMTRMHLSAVIDAIERNRPIVKRFYRFEQAVLIMLPIIVALILALAWLPRV